MHLWHCWFKCNQKTLTWESFWTPKTSRQNESNSIFLLENYHSSTYPVWRASPMKLAWVMMNFNQNTRQNFTSSKHPDCSTLVFVSPYTERLMRREKATPPLGVKAHATRYLFLLILRISGNLTDIWLILKFSKIPDLQSADHSSPYFFYFQEDLTLLNLVPSHNAPYLAHCSISHFQNKE